MTSFLDNLAEKLTAENAKKLSSFFSVVKDIVADKSEPAPVSDFVDTKFKVVDYDNMLLINKDGVTVSQQFLQNLGDFDIVVTGFDSKLPSSMKVTLQTKPPPKGKETKDRTHIEFIKEGTKYRPNVSMSFLECLEDIGIVNLLKRASLEQGRFNFVKQHLQSKGFQVFIVGEDEPAPTVATELVATVCAVPPTGTVSSSNPSPPSAGPYVPFASNPFGPAIEKIVIKEVPVYVDKVVVNEVPIYVDKVVIKEVVVYVDRVVKDTKETASATPTVTKEQAKVPVTAPVKLPVKEPAKEEQVKTTVKDQPKERVAEQVKGKGPIQEPSSSSSSDEKDDEESGDEESGDESDQESDESEQESDQDESEEQEESEEKTEKVKIKGKYLNEQKTILKSGDFVYRVNKKVNGPTELLAISRWDDAKPAGKERVPLRKGDKKIIEALGHKVAPNK